MNSMQIEKSDTLRQNRIQPTRFAVHTDTSPAGMAMNTVWHIFIIPCDDGCAKYFISNCEIHFKMLI
jgi:hypothetical protein